MHPGMYEKYFQCISLLFQCCQPLCWKSLSQVALSETGPVMWILDMILLSQKGLIMKNFSCSLFKQITGWQKKISKAVLLYSWMLHNTGSHKMGKGYHGISPSWYKVYVLCQLYRFFFTGAPGIFFSCAGTLQQHRVDCTCCANIRDRIPNQWD